MRLIVSHLATLCLPPLPTTLLLSLSKILAHNHNSAIHPGLSSILSPFPSAILAFPFLLSTLSMKEPSNHPTSFPTAYPVPPPLHTPIWPIILLKPQIGNNLGVLDSLFITPSSPTKFPMALTLQALVDGPLFVSRGNMDLLSPSSQPTGLAIAHTIWALFGTSISVTFRPRGCLLQIRALSLTQTFWLLFLPLWMQGTMLLLALTIMMMSAPVGLPPSSDLWVFLMLSSFSMHLLPLQLLTIGIPPGLLSILFRFLPGLSSTGLVISLLIALWL